MRNVATISPLEDRNPSFVGNNLTSNIRISQGFSAVSPSIAVDSNNNIHIVWQDNRRSRKWDIYYKKLDNAGNDLTGEIELSYAKRYCTHPSIAIDSNNNVHIAWYDSRYENSKDWKKCGIYYDKLRPSNTKRGDILWRTLRPPNGSKSDC